MSSPLLVLDTNVVLDLLHFDDGDARPVLAALQSGRVCCVATRQTLDELRRVLAYPEFALDPARQAAILERYQAMSLMVENVAASVEMPLCSDPDDQKFLELAAASRAQGLVSKDQALLKLRRRCAPHFQVMTPAEAGRWLDVINGG